MVHMKYRLQQGDNGEEKADHLRIDQDMIISISYTFVYFKLGKKGVKKTNVNTR